jgi:beta-lactamase class A
LANRAFPRPGPYLLVLALSAIGCERDPPPDAEPPPAEAAASEAVTAPVRDTVLEIALRQFAAEIEGTVGVAVLHLQRDVYASLNGDHPFMLASVYKLPIAYAALQRDHLQPSDTVRVTAEDRAPGDSPFASGMAVPVARLVTRSLAHSDNTASDVLLRVGGGPEEVSRRIHALGVHDVRVDRSMRRTFAEWQGRPDADALLDTGTANGIVALLAALHRGETLGPEARRVVLDALGAADTGPNRIRAGVPEGTAVAHKTGTLGPLTHDVGIVTLPEGRGDVALAVLMDSHAPLGLRERLIAALSRLVWERFAGDDMGLSEPRVMP